MPKKEIFNNNNNNNNQQKTYPDQLEDGQSEKLNLQKFSKFGDTTGPGKNGTDPEQKKSFIEKAKDGIKNAAVGIKDAIAGEGSGKEKEDINKNDRSGGQPKKKKIEEAAQQPPGMKNLDKNDRMKPFNEQKRSISMFAATGEGIPFSNRQLAWSRNRTPLLWSPWSSRNLQKTMFLFRRFRL